MISAVIGSEALREGGVWSPEFFICLGGDKPDYAYPMVSLRELVRERREIVDPQSTDAFGKDYLGLENIEPGTRALMGDLRPSADVKSSAKRFMRGDILYGRLRPALNKLYLVEGMDEGVCSTEIFVLVPDTGVVDPVFLSELLISVPVNEEIVSLVRGASLPRIDLNDFLDMTLPIPPISVQKEIASYTETRRREYREAKERADRIPDDIRRNLLRMITRG
ncbi:MAG: hypothetical protein FWH47_07480 [Methanomassiliicoccaceae archaeon]|nr:hypothetical protein [Methanomassiliicoccaceae archaeon]